MFSLMPRLSSITVLNLMRTMSVLKTGTLFLEEHLFSVYQPFCCCFCFYSGYLCDWSIRLSCRWFFSPTILSLQHFKEKAMCNVSVNTFDTHTWYRIVWSGLEFFFKPEQTTNQTAWLTQHVLLECCWLCCRQLTVVSSVAALTGTSN